MQINLTRDSASLCRGEAEEGAQWSLEIMGAPEEEVYYIYPLVVA